MLKTVFVFASIIKMEEVSFLHQIYFKVKKDQNV